MAIDDDTVGSADISSDLSKESQKVETLPVLPLRDVVVFPHMVVPLFVGREKSVRALEKAMEGDHRAFLVTQKDPGQDNPARDDLYDVGVVASILQLLKLPDGAVKILVEGVERARIERFDDGEACMEAQVAPVPDVIEDAEHIEGLARSARRRFENYVKLSKKISSDVLEVIARVDDVALLADTMAAHIQAKLSERQEMLEIISLTDRLEKIYIYMEKEIGVLQVEKKIRGRVKHQMEKNQREYYLNEQMKAIQKELGESEDGKDDIAELEERIEKVKLTKAAREKARAEIKKLRQMSGMSAESSVVRNYLDWILSLPWGAKGRIKKDLKAAEKILNEDHYGLEKVKERILEYLAVQQRTNKIKGPILCLVGPPGVGKTSLGRSIARATGRGFVRMSLGGVRDEAEIRGHRRTYIGSMPGRVLQSLKKVKYNNPLFLLDEIDKLGADFRGDPSAALLEVLDPEQNNAFADHYLELDYDLSHIMFVTTANTLDIPPPLADRMEIIRIAGYTEDEKIEIARRHLLPKVVEAHGLCEGEWSLDDGALKELIRTYTREAGVRNLEREINNLTRKAVRSILTDGVESINVSTNNLADYAGVPKYRHGEAEEKDQVGVVTGLAWTEMGGELLTVEGVIAPGKGKVTITGNLRDVMKESVTAANSYVKSRACSFGIEPSLFEKNDIHVHVPEGATPKDGPSAGIAMAVAIASTMAHIPVRRDIAMTGEITLRGRVLPIGGLKEKLLAALRGGINTVLIPQENARDLPDIPEKVKEALEIIPVATMDDVIGRALTKKVTSLSSDEGEGELYNTPQEATGTPLQEAGETIIAH
ncbi:MAG: endopeptidase La [Parvularculales bacterium]